MEFAGGNSLHFCVIKLNSEYEIGGGIPQFTGKKQQILKINLNESTLICRSEFDLDQNLNFGFLFSTNA